MAAMDGAETGESGPQRDAGMIGVLLKAFHAMEAMAELGEPVPLREIARATGLPKGTLFRILQTLTALGYVGQERETGHYHLTSQIAHLGRNSGHEDLKMLALPVMRALHAKYNETVNLGVLEGTFVYYVTVLEAQRPLSWRVPSGTRDLYYSTALGRAIAAHLDPAQLDRLLARTNLRSRTSSTVRDKAGFLAVLEEVRRSGVALEREETDAGVVCIGVPLSIGGRVVAAISLSIPSTRFSEELGADMRRTLLGLKLDFPALPGLPAALDPI